MLDLKFVRDNLDAVKENLRLRRTKLDLSEFETLSSQRNALIVEGDELRHEQKQANEKIKDAKKAGESPAPIIARMKDVSTRIKDLETEAKAIDEKLEELLMHIPNMLDPSVPEGDTDADNVEVRKWGTPRPFDFEPKDHVDVGEGLDILDMARGAKLAGARFPLLKGAGAMLETALANFFLSEHMKKGYTQVSPPVMVNSQALIGTGQLPKFAEDLFKIKGHDLWLIPTAEVPVTNIFQDEILDEASLPYFYCAFTPCFRSEAGSYGKDTRGMIRNHQFYKVELVKLVHPEKSWEEHEALTADAENLLRKLELPYRVMTLSSGDVGFSAAKCYDLEVWLPSFNGYREISSCSNFLDFQARRAKIRFRSKSKKGTQYLHTINGSGLAIGRTIVAILENYQQSDGTVVVPKALRPFMGGLELIK